MIQTLRFFANFSNLSKFRKFKITDESLEFYMNRSEVWAASYEIGLRPLSYETRVARMREDEHVSP